MTNLSPEECLSSLEKQLREVRMGVRRTVIRCPYCRLENNPDVPLCCGLFSLATRAILDRLDVEESREQYERIGESLSYGKRRN